MQRFIHEQNLTRYIDLLDIESNPLTRRQIQKLLIEEEDRFGSLTERIDQADILIRRSQARLRQQQALVTRLKNDGAETATAVALVETMNQTLQLVAAYRQTLSDGPDGGNI